MVAVVFFAFFSVACNLASRVPYIARLLLDLQ